MPNLPLSHSEIWGILPSRHFIPLPVAPGVPADQSCLPAGAEEFGLIGSTEFTEVSEPRSWALEGIRGAGAVRADVAASNGRSSAGLRAVAYINVDISVFGMRAGGADSGSGDTKRQAQKESSLILSQPMPP